MRLLREDCDRSIALAVALGGCSLGGVLGGGGKAPATLLTLTPGSGRPGPDRPHASAAGQAVTIAMPVMPKELRTVRVPVQVTPTDVQYVDQAAVGRHARPAVPAELVAETVRRTTDRVVLDPRQSDARSRACW